MLLVTYEKHTIFSHPLPKQPSAKELIIIGGRIKRRRPEAGKPRRKFMMSD
jgi:hypothetical protein